ncbi:MAG: HAMP domain-containing histidine kinase [Clostridiales bacterium]|nr:HAMP domain-containing histidine kinase [Clostridiales bacterium]
MIKKLRIKLIGASMLSLFLVLTIITGTANLLNYKAVTDDADILLSILAENEGTFPLMFENRQREEFLESPELPYESRYFYIVLDNDGEILSTNIDWIAAIDESAASEYAKAVWKTNKDRGFLKDYRYIISRTDYETYVVFLDCRRSLNNAKSFLIASIITSVAGWFAVLILLALLSGRIVRPFSENYEKQKRFITDAGHELKTPLAIINADAEVLEMDIGENEWLNDIHSQTKHMAELTNSLIVLSRMEEDDTPRDVSEFSLSKAAAETVNSFKAPAKAQGKTLESDIDENIVMKGDEKAVRRLMGILLDNAVKYSGEEGKISLSLKETRKTLRLYVYNTAPCVKKENLPYLFDRFYRTDSSRNSETGGYGLGLSIAASTVRLHKGKITASTEDEKSLLITVTFPI